MTSAWNICTCLLTGVAAARERRSSRFQGGCISISALRRTHAPPSINIPYRDWADLAGKKGFRAISSLLTSPAGTRTAAFCTGSQST
jgi:hypothetical protein